MRPTPLPPPTNPAHRSPYDDPSASADAMRVLEPGDVTAALRRARWRLLVPLVGNVIAFVVGVVVLVPIGGPWLLIGFQLAVLLGVAKWAESIWICPRCEKPLGRSLTPVACPHCGQAFRARD